MFQKKIMRDFKKCPNGHFYEGDYCPYCPTQYYSLDDVKPYVGAGNLRPRALEQMTIPSCPHCGQPLRKGIPRPHLDPATKSNMPLEFGSVYGLDGIVPWNYEWDGKCEYCGHDFSIKWGIRLHSTDSETPRIRETNIKAKAIGYYFNSPTADLFITTVLSGVEIETRCGSQRERLFLSANELKYLIKVLQDSPLIKQFDYLQGYWR